MSRRSFKPGPDTKLWLLSRDDFTFVLVSLGAVKVYANSEELADALGVKRPEGEMDDGKDLARCQKLLLDAGFDTPREMAEEFDAPVPLTATRTQVARYAERDGCHKADADNGDWCEVHGSYYDHEPWTFRGCAHAAHEADFALWVAGKK